MQPFEPLLERATELAATWHSGTFRKGQWGAPVYTTEDGRAAPVPVFSHLTAVALTVQRAGWPADVVAAAFLHDILEDPNRDGERMTRETLAAHMDEELVTLVQHVTEDGYDESGQKRPWRTRKEAYIAHLEQAPDEAVAISLADKLHNLWTMSQSLEAGLPLFEGGDNFTALSAGPAEQQWFFHAMLRATMGHSDQRLHSLRAQLTQELDRFEQLAFTQPT